MKETDLLFKDMFDKEPFMFNLLMVLLGICLFFTNCKLCIKGLFRK